MVGAGTVFPHCMQSEIANLAGSLTGTGNIQLGATTDGPSSPDNFTGLGTVDGMRACSAGHFAPFNTKTAAYEDNVVSWPSVEPADDYTANSLMAFALGADRVLALADAAFAEAPWAGAGAPRPAVLAIDGGNSKTDVALVAGDGTLLASARGPGINAHEVGVDQTVLILDAVVKQAAAQLDRPPSDPSVPSGPLARHTVACLANADLPEEEAEHATAVQAQGWSESATVVNDTFAILRSGLPDAVEGPGPHWGVAVVCGAGINAVGVAPDGRVTRYLSLGTISGDWGGGYGLGLEVLWHAIRAEDGRGPATALADSLTSHFGVERVEDVTIGIHKGKIPDDDLTGLAPILLRASDEGDAVARQVVERLAGEISVMAITAMRRLDLTGLATPVVLGGGVITARNPLLISGITRQLAAAAPAAQVRVIDVPPVAGAALLGLDHVHAPAAAASRLRAAYGISRP